MDPIAAAPEAKKPWQSKTMIASAITALLPVVWPHAAVWVAANPELFSAALGALFGVLRTVTKEKVVIK